MNLNDWVSVSFQNSRDHGFWSDGDADDRTVLAQKVALLHSELSELLEAYRNDPKWICQKIPAMTVEEEEMADVAIRLFDLAGARGIDLERAVMLKHEFNKQRPVKHGKAF